METRREDVSIAIRSAFLRKDTQQRFSLFVLVIIAVVLILVEKIETKPLNYFRGFIKDSIYRGSEIITYPLKSFGNSAKFIESHLNLYINYKQL